MQPRILLRPAGTSGMYYSAHNLTRRPVDIELPPASSLVNFPPAYTRVQESKPSLPDVHSTSYFELIKQKNDDILQRYMAEAIADNKRAMAAAGLLEPEDRPRPPEPTNFVPSPPSVPSSEAEAPHVMETILHLSKSVPRDSSVDPPCPVVSIPGTTLPFVPSNNSSVYSTLPPSHLNNTASSAPTTTNAPVPNNSEGKKQTSSSGVSDEQIHEVPTNSAEIFAELLKTKRTKKARSSSKRRKDKEKLLEIAARNAQLSQTFTQSILNLEHLSQKEKELSQYAHFATVLQSERLQSDQREQAQAQAIQLLLRRIADLEDLTRQQQMVAPVHPFIPSHVPLQPYSTLPSAPNIPAAPSHPPPPYWPSYSMLPNPSMYSGPDTGTVDRSSGSLSCQHTSAATPSQVPHVKDNISNFLSKPAVKIDNSEFMTTSQPTSVEDLTYDQKTNPIISKFTTTDDYTDEEAGHRRMRFRAKVFTTIPPDPPPLPADDRYGVATVTPRISNYGAPQTESPDFSPPVIQSLNIVRLPPRPVKKVATEVPTFILDKLVGASHSNINAAEFTMPSPIDKSIAISTDKESSFQFPRTIVTTSFPSNFPKDLMPIKPAEATSKHSEDGISCFQKSANETSNNTVMQDILHESLHEKTQISSNSISRLVEQTEETVTTGISFKLCSDQYVNSSDHANDNLQLSHSTEGHSSAPISSGSSLEGNPLAPNLEYDTKISYPNEQLREADSPHALQLSYDKELNTDNSAPTSKHQKGRRIKFMDCSTSSSGTLSSASKASTVSVEVAEYEEEEYKNAFRAVQNSNLTGLHTTLHDSSSSLDAQGSAFPQPRLGSNLNITGISPAFPSSLSPRSFGQKSSAIKSGKSGTSDVLNEQSTDKVTHSSEASSSLLEPSDTNAGPKTHSHSTAHQTAPPQKNESRSSGDIVSDFADLELELQQESATSGLNQSLGLMNSLIESASNQASMFKRNLEEALRRSHDASLVADRISTLSPEQNEILIEQEQVLWQPPNQDNHLDPEDYELGFSTDKGTDSLSEHCDRRSRTSDVCSAKAPLTATTLLSTIQKGLSAMSLSSRHSLNSSQNSFLTHSTESPRDYRLFLPNDSSIIGYQPEFVPPEDEYMVEDPELFPSHCLEDIEGSIPSVQEQDQIVTQGDIHDNIDLDTPRDGCSEDQFAHNEDYISGVDAPYVSLDVAGSSSCPNELLESTTKEAVVFNMKLHGVGTSASLASSSSVPSPKRTLILNQNQGPPHGLGFGIGQRKVYGATSTMPALPIVQTQSDRASSSDDFNVASLSSKTESTSPLKPTQVSKANFTFLPQNRFPKGAGPINPVASESEPSPEENCNAATRPPVISQHVMATTNANAPKHIQPNLDEELDTIPDLDLLGSMSYIPDLNSTSISEERLLRDHSSGSSRAQTRFSVNVDVDGVDNFYELDVDLGEDDSEFEDL
ncbi:Hypothetical protein GLP15_2060 [Giardia lamblia P15]|uniref:Uncharacterized protein n=1 Tax=Giardia intestinalis (strain P15) TaxID=658858 RepID=E1F013_GIAIA|nr:Hypothetical protein GLP15_2060 [Giardia lamblia P15]